MKKRMLSLWTALALCLTLLPITALAGEHSDHAGWTALTADTISSGTLSTGSYYLNGDVEYTGSTPITVSGEVTLCLNGHVLNLNGRYIQVNSGAKFTLCDCQTTETKGYISGNLWKQGTPTDDDATVCNLTGGVITGGKGYVDNQGNTYGGGVYVDGGTFTLESGNIAGNYTPVKEGSIIAYGGGVYVDGGIFTMSGGSITGNYSITHGGGVYVDGGAFDLSGGSITGNKSDYIGGGVEMYGGTFNLSGGSITGNTAIVGGGMEMYGGDFNLSGNPTIQDNTLTDQATASNIYLKTGKVINITGALTNSEAIGVTMEAPGTFTSGWSSNMQGKDPASYFSSDATAYGVALNSSEAKLASRYTVTLNTNGGTIHSGQVTAYLEGVGANLPTDVTKSGYTFAGWYDNQELTGNPVSAITAAETGHKEYWAKWTVNQPPTYTISVSADPAEGGTVSGGGSYVSGSTVSLTAAPAEGWYFVAWVENGQQVSTQAAYSFSASGSRALTARFEAVPVTGVALDQGELALAMGETGTLTPVFQPSNAANQTVTWSSSDTNVAAVDENGTVTAVGVGTAAVTVTTEDGGYTASCTVTVTIPVTGVTLDKTGFFLAVGSAAALTATVEPGNATNPRLIWESDNQMVATVDNGRVTAVSTGTAVITAAAADGSGVFAACTVTVIPAPAPAEEEDDYEPPTGPSSGAYQGWDRIESGLEKLADGETFTVEMNGETTLPGDILDAIAGRDVTLQVELDGAAWVIQGTDLPAGTSFGDLDFGVETGTSGIPVDVINALTGEQSTLQMTLAHSGDFGFSLTLKLELGRELAGSWANLYYYNEGIGALEFQYAARIGGTGIATFPFDHASQYAVVIDRQSHAPAEEPQPEPEGLPFADVAENAWYYEAVAYVYEKGLMDGTSETAFSPEMTTSRAMVAAVLWRLAGSPVVNYAMDFADVGQGQWYTEAVRWAASERIVSGYDNGQFGTNDPITREQLAVMLWRFAQSMGYDVSVGEDTNILSYADAFAVSEYAVPALQWACGAGIISGTGDGSTLTPQGHAARAETAAMLLRLGEGI